MKTLSDLIKNILKNNQATFYNRLKSSVTFHFREHQEGKKLIRGKFLAKLLTKGIGARHSN